MKDSFNLFAVVALCTFRKFTEQDAITYPGVDDRENAFIGTPAEGSEIDIIMADGTISYHNHLKGNWAHFNVKLNLQGK